MYSGGCSGSNGGYQRYRSDFFDTFDTVVTVIAYMQSEAEFDQLSGIVHSSFLEYHQLFDIYHNYDGINNIKTINDNAGIKPVEVDERIIYLLQQAKLWYQETNGVINIALGPVLNIWHTYRETGLANPASAKVPPIDELRNAKEYTNIDGVIIDEQALTVYLTEKNMCLDVGAVAKGYAVEAIAAQLIEKEYDSILISAGGNIRAIGIPKDGVRSKWGVGIKDPDSLLQYSTNEENLLDVAFVTNTSVVSSGSYERYYTVGDKSYHHLIDPQTLMPADYYKAVTVVTKDSLKADVLSTVLFLMPPEQSIEFAESMQDVEALWVMAGNQLVFSSGMKQLLRDMGKASYK